MKLGYNAILLIVAGLGGLLYGIDVGIIGGALPYLQATSGLSQGQLSAVVAAVLLGSVFSTLFAGILADWMGRKYLMQLSGIAFAISIPVIALSSGYTYLLFGRLLQGVSGGFIGVVVPLYLAECLAAKDRGKGTAMFQWMLTLGIVAAALMGMYFSYQVEAVARLHDAIALFNFKNHAWRSIFWVSLPPGLLFVLGSFFVGESPRWLFLRGKREKALTELLRSRTQEQANYELTEMETSARSNSSGSTSAIKDSLLRRKYVVPFLLACVILFCNTATGVNSIIGYNTGILIQSGLSDLSAHWGYVLFTIVNFVMTMVGMTLVDRKGRKFLLTLGTSGIILSLSAVDIGFLQTEKQGIDCRNAVQSMVSAGQELNLTYNRNLADKLLSSTGNNDTALRTAPTTFSVIYSYGDFTAAANSIRSDDSLASIAISRAELQKKGRVEALFGNPFGDLKTAQTTAPLKIEKAMITPAPTSSHGWMIATGLYLFMAFFAIGPGVCVWLALSELMPTRIRSNGMSIALVINQLVSTTLAGIFLPFVSRYGYSHIFFLFVGFTILYLLTAVFFLPETKGKTLEEIEAHFSGVA